jgi:hypothetical protein
VIGFSEVQLTEQTLPDYADTLAYLGAAVRLYRDTFRRLGLLGGQGRGEQQGSQDGEGNSRPARPRAVQGRLWLPATPVVLGPRQAVHPGPISCGVCGQDFQPNS